MGSGSSQPKQAPQPQQQQQQQQGNQNSNHNQTGQQQSSKEDENTSEIKIKKVKMDKKCLERYINLEKEAHTLGSKNTLKGIEVKQEHLKDLQETVKQLDQHYKDCVKQTEKELSDVEKLKEPTVKNMLEKMNEYDAAFTKEQEEYLEALNKQEIAKRELDGVTKQVEQVQKELKTLDSEGQKLKKIQKDMDELLASIFEGNYGSELEYNLESELDVLEDRKSRISIAKYKWTNARVLLQHAVNQLSLAVTKWKEVSSAKKEQKYNLATEARNNLVAANQNITSAAKYLHTIKFPYCTQDEMETLARATNNIYTDMGSEERHSHAMACYSTTSKRAHALLQWFDSVIKNTISVDLEKATTETNAKETELRTERLRLIKEKIREANNGKEMNLDIKNEMDLGDDTDTTLQTVAVDADNKAISAPAKEPSKSSVAQPAAQPEPAAGENEKQGSDTSSGQPLAEGDLAPPPKEEDIFRDIADLKDKHQQDLAEYQKAQTEDVDTEKSVPTKEPEPEPEPEPVVLPEQPLPEPPKREHIVLEYDDVKDKLEKDMAKFQKNQEVNKARMEQGLAEKLRARRSRRQRMEGQE